MTSANLPPRSGRQFSLKHGDYAAVVTELGASLRELAYQSKEVVCSWPADETAPCSNGRVLIPFPNRIADGAYTFGGTTYQLSIDEIERRNASPSGRSNSAVVVPSAAWCRSVHASS